MFGMRLRVADLKIQLVAGVIVLRGKKKKKASSQPSVSTALCSVNLCHRAFTLCDGPACCWKAAFFSVSTKQGLRHALVSRAPVPVFVLDTKGLGLQRSIRDWLLHPLQPDIDNWNLRSCSLETVQLFIHFIHSLTNLILSFQFIFLVQKFTFSCCFNFFSPFGFYILAVPPVHFPVFS